MSIHVQLLVSAFVLWLISLLALSVLAARSETVALREIPATVEVRVLPVSLPETPAPIAEAKSWGIF
jgi:hypothetical protein